MTKPKSKPAADKAVPAKKVAKKAAKKVAGDPAPAKSKTGISRRGTPKKYNVPDSSTDQPVMPDKEPSHDHIKRGIELGLTLKEIEFVEVYLTCYNGTRSYMEVFGSKNYNASGIEASKTLRRDRVKTYLSERMKAAFERTEAAQDQIIQTYTMVAYGDVNELVEHRRDACRYCYGDGHGYQFTPAEFERAKESHRKEQADARANARGGAFTPAEFDPLGGIGYHPNREPHPECPECFGDGVSRIHFHDTRSLSPSALAMYEGAEITKNGMNIKTSSRDGAREKLAKILKVYEDSKTEVTISLSADALEATYGERMRRAREKSEAMRKERGIPSED